MTKTETIELAEARKDISYMSEDISDIKSDIKLIIAKLENQEKKFITRIEGKVAVGVVSLLIALMSFWFSFKDHVKY